MLLRNMWWLCAFLLTEAPIGSTGAMLASRRDRASEQDDNVNTCYKEITSATNKTGIFTSPFYPEPYPQGVTCTYNFTGTKRERIQITFTDFDLHLPHETPKDCEMVDAVMIYIIINGNKVKLDNFCGNMIPKNLMSNDAAMLVEFKSRHSSPEVKGFRAIYKFVTDFGIAEGRQHEGTACEFTFKSEESSNGTFSSPNYPGLYPRDTECNYIFKGREKERVEITFTEFNVDGIFPCDQDTASDYVEFSNFKTRDRKIPRQCGNEKPKYIESDSDYFRITFRSNEKFDATGFLAQYQFKKQEDPFTVKRISTTSVNESSIGSPLRMNTVFFYFLPAIFYVTYYIKL